MLTCPYCGSSRLQKVGGESGDPFDRRKEKTICLDCGRAVGTKPDTADLFQSVICIEMTAEGGGTFCTAKAGFPLEDGKYDLSLHDYPLCRYKYLKVNGNIADLGGEICVSLTDTPYETTRQYTVYALDKHPEIEIVKIKIYIDIII